MTSLSGLAVGTLDLQPEFDSDVTEYSVTTENATNKVTATATDPYAVITIKLGDTTVDNGSSVAWAEGENILTITVTGGAPATVYTVTVTQE